MIDPRLLQLCDSAFPSGAFSHSFGLETAIADGRVADAASARAWIAAYLGETAAPCDAAAVALVIAGAAAGELDAFLAAALFAAELRAATRRLARATLDAYDAMGIDDDRLRGYRAAIESGRAGGHHAVACGLGYRAIDADPHDACCAHLSATAAALAAAAARAIPLGQRDVGALLWSLRSQIADGARRAAAVRAVDELCSGAIACEIDAMRHAQLDGRLFAS